MWIERRKKKRRRKCIFKYDDCSARFIYEEYDDECSGNTL